MLDLYAPGCGPDEEATGRRRRIIPCNECGTLETMNPGDSLCEACDEMQFRRDHPEVQRG